MGIHISRTLHWDVQSSLLTAANSPVLISNDEFVGWCMYCFMLDTVTIDHRVRVFVEESLLLRWLCGSSNGTNLRLHSQDLRLLMVRNSLVHWLIGCDVPISLLGFLVLLLLLDVWKVLSEGSHVIVGFIDERVLVEGTSSPVCVVYRSLFVFALAFESLAVLVLVATGGSCGLEVGLETRALTVLLMKRHDWSAVVMT